MKSINNWFAFAEEDLKVANSSIKQGIFNQVCFHSQQGAEKMLKGFLNSQNKIIPKIHFLSDLLSICAGIDKSFERYRPTIVKLDDYYPPSQNAMGVSP